MDRMCGTAFVKDYCCCIGIKSNFKIFAKFQDFSLRGQNLSRLLWTVCSLPISEEYCGRPLITAFLLPDKNISLTLDLPFSFMWKAALNASSLPVSPGGLILFISVYKSRPFLTLHNSCHDLSVLTGTPCSISKYSTTDSFLYRPAI